MIPTAAKPIRPDTTAVGNGTIAGLTYPLAGSPSRGSIGRVPSSVEDPIVGPSGVRGPLPPRFVPDVPRVPNTSPMDGGTVPLPPTDVPVPTCTVSADAIPADNKTRAAQARPTMRFSIASSRFSRVNRSGEFPPGPLRASLTQKISDGNGGINPMRRRNEEKITMETGGQKTPTPGIQHFAKPHFVRR